MPGTDTTADSTVSEASVSDPTMARNPTAGRATAESPDSDRCSRRRRRARRSSAPRPPFRCARSSGGSGRTRAATAAGWRSASCFIALVPLVETAMIWMFKVVVDEVLVPRDFGPFVWIAGAYRRPDTARRRPRLRRRVPGDLDRRALPARPAHPLLRPPAGPLARLLRAPPARRRDLAADGRHRRDRVVRPLRRRRRALLCAPDRLLRRRPLLSAVGPRADLAASSRRSSGCAAKRFSRLIKLASREKRRRSGSISSVAEESLSNAALVQAYGREAGRGRALPPREPGQLPRRDGLDAAEGALLAA